uniref:LNS2 domain-containing protein n=1 Tax=Macrostomum lignano TaxID=282301 RepID=A0A1I8IEP7_9PLAT
GTASCLCEVHLWRHDDRIVVSDIDGTITRSDLLGQLLPIVGQDWIQPTVTSLFSAVGGNGYRFLYLSSRGLGQSEATRRFLDRISQEGAGLPGGPVLLSPDSLLAALHREVIARRPQDFKIPCLRDIRALFQTAHKVGGPFWAGFGNRPTDADTYAKVGIPLERCFTVNSRGELLRGGCYQMDGCGWAPSYRALMDIVDHVFPKLKNRTVREFSNQITNL